MRTIVDMRSAVCCRRHLLVYDDGQTSHKYLFKEKYSFIDEDSKEPGSRPAAAAENKAIEQQQPLLQQITSSLGQQEGGGSRGKHSAGKAVPLQVETLPAGLQEAQDVAATPDSRHHASRGEQAVVAPRRSGRLTATPGRPPAPAPPTAAALPDTPPGGTQGSQQPPLPGTTACTKRRTRSSGSAQLDTGVPMQTSQNKRQKRAAAAAEPAADGSSQQQKPSITAQAVRATPASAAAPLHASLAHVVSLGCEKCPDEKKGCKACYATASAALVSGLQPALHSKQMGSFTGDMKVAFIGTIVMMLHVMRFQVERVSLAVLINCC